LPHVVPVPQAPEVQAPLQQSEGCEHALPSAAQLPPELLPLLPPLLLLPLPVPQVPLAVSQLPPQQSES
jgi:hypothetical protein